MNAITRGEGGPGDHEGAAGQQRTLHWLGQDTPRPKARCQRLESEKGLRIRRRYDLHRPKLKGRTEEAAKQHARCNEPPLCGGQCVQLAKQGHRRRDLGAGKSKVAKTGNRRRAQEEGAREATHPQQAGVVQLRRIVKLDVVL